MYVYTYRYTCTYTLDNSCETTHQIDLYSPYTHTCLCTCVHKHLYTHPTMNFNM